jgi:hypothetical protein
LVLSVLKSQKPEEVLGAGDMWTAPRCRCWMYMRPSQIGWGRTCAAVPRSRPAA